MVGRSHFGKQAEIGVRISLSDTKTNTFNIMAYFRTSFVNLEDAENEYKRAKELYDQLVGSIYKNAIGDELIKIHQEIQKLKNTKA